MGVLVNDVVPPRCMDCDKPLTTTKELNQRIDFGIDWCEACEDEAERNECACSYPYFMGGDPRQFEPEQENSPVELAAWRAACEAWERGQQADPPVEEHGPWVDRETGAVTLGDRPPGVVIGGCHAVRSFGMGSTYCKQHRPPVTARQEGGDE
jgi:hypothetical protein